MKMDPDEVLGMTAGVLRRKSAQESRMWMKRMMRYWHPDANTHVRAGDVFRHLVALKASLARDSDIAGIVLNRGGKMVRYKAQQVGGCDVGERWIAHRSFAMRYTLAPDLAERAMKMVARLPFADDGMRNQMAHFFPSNQELCVDDAQCPVVLSERRSMAVLRDWLGHHGPLPVDHLAWMVSGLCNVLAWADWADWSLCGLSLDTVGFDPVKHQVGILGGWEFAFAPGDKIACVPERVLDIFPGVVQGQSVPSWVMTEIVKDIAITAAGGVGVVTSTSFPKAIGVWLLSAPGMKGKDAYKGWYKALEADFGPRRFVKWDKKVHDIPGYDFL